MKSAPQEAWQVFSRRELNAWVHGSALYSRSRSYGFVDLGGPQNLRGRRSSNLGHIGFGFVVPRRRATRKDDLGPAIKCQVMLFNRGCPHPSHREDDEDTFDRLVKDYEERRESE